MDKHNLELAAVSLL